MTTIIETGFVPTVTDSTKDGDDIILHTLDPRPESDIVLRYGEVPTRVGDLLTEEQQEVLRLIE